MDFPPNPITFNNGLKQLPKSLATGLSYQALPGLNGIRAIAALLVVYHFELPGVSGGMGGLIFFVLSGFLITWLLLTEQERTSTIALRKFYARRTLRIFPALCTYWLLLIAALVLSRKTIHWAQAVCSFFYVNNYYQGICGDPNTGLSHTWSLGVEEQFYLLWPVTFLALSRDRRRLAYRLVGLIGILWLYRFVMRFGFHVWQGYVYEAFDMRADHLLIGCLLAVSLRSRMFIPLWEFLSGSWLPGALTVGALVLVSVMEQNSPDSFRDGVSFTVAPILSAFLIVSAIAFSGRGLWRVLDWNWMRYLGRISYSIYLYQQLNGGIARKFTGHEPDFVQLAGTVMLTILAATGSYFIVERYFLSLKARCSNWWALRSLRVLPRRNAIVASRDRSSRTSLATIQRHKQRRQAVKRCSDDKQRLHGDFGYPPHRELLCQPHREVGRLEPYLGVLIVLLLGNYFFPWKRRVPTPQKSKISSVLRSTKLSSNVRTVSRALAQCVDCF